MNEQERKEFNGVKQELALFQLNQMKKNADYASADDPLMNFRAGGLLGIVIRKGDKAIRDINVTRKGGAAVAETLRDTRLDEINYAILALFAEEEGMLP